MTVSAVKCQVMVFMTTEEIWALGPCCNATFPQALGSPENNLDNEFIRGPEQSKSVSRVFFLPTDLKILLSIFENSIFPEEKQGFLNT